MNTLLKGAVTAPVQFYPDFLSPVDKQHWLTQSRALEWKRGELTMYGKKIPVPREEALFGDDHRYEYRGTVLKAEPWPDFLLEARDRIQAVCGLAFHFAVGNRYVTGKDSIGWHSDSFPQIGARPAIASLSLGSTRRFKLRHKATGETFDYDLESGSLLIMLPGCQEEWEHAVLKPPGPWANASTGPSGPTGTHKHCLFPDYVMMSTPQSFTLRFTGDYSLSASVTLAAGAAFVDKLYGGPAGETLDLALLLEDSWHTVGVRVDQPQGQLRACVLANPGQATSTDVRAQLERLLSLDTDGTDFAAVGAHDSVIAGLQEQHPGIRPVLLPSPYEAAARAIISHQLPLRQAATITARIAEAHGVRVDLESHVLHGFPAPSQLAELPTIRGLAARKVAQLRVLGAAAATGVLSSTRLRALPREVALVELQRLSGIGPFSAELVMMRGVGEPDAFPRTEKRLHRAMAAAYNLGEEPALAVLEDVAEKWRPYRNWAGLLLRNFQPVSKNVVSLDR